MATAVCDIDWSSDQTRTYIFIKGEGRVWTSDIMHFSQDEDWEMGMVGSKES